MNNALQRRLIVLGLVIIPFYELIIRLLPFIRIVSPDSRQPKEILAVIFALSIGLLTVFQGGIKPFKNKWLLIIPVYLLFNLINAPHFDMFINNIESGDFYFWKPFAESLCFLLMIVAIASMEFDSNKILNLMVICGLIMSIYVIMQWFGFDQFWVGKEDQQFTGVPSYRLGGNLGQPTVVASFIVMLIPLAFYLKKFWMAIVMVIATLLTKSHMALLALALMWIITLCYLNPNILKPIIFILLIGAVTFCIFYKTSHQFRGKIETVMTGRLDVWKNMYGDIRDGAIEGNKQDYSMTGVGFGRFGFIFPDKHKSEFQQAHNDPYELLYNCGFIGLGLLLMSLFYIGWIPINNGLHFSILLSFITILFCSLGSFPFQLGAHQFYSSILVGLLHNESINRRSS